MRRRTSATVAGVTLLLYIIIGVAQMIIGRGVVRGQGTAVMLASIASHAGSVRVNALLGLATSFVALTLGVALYGLTREEDHELAMLALMCRVAEGVVGSLPALASLGLLWLASNGSTGVPSESPLAAAELLVKLRGLLPLLGATFFAVGSLLFTYLLLRGRMIPRSLALLGVVASAVLVLLLPGQLAGIIGSPVTSYMWAPMAVFEVVLAVWLLAQGTTVPTHPAA